MAMFFDSFLSLLLRFQEQISVRFASECISVIYQLYQLWLRADYATRWINCFTGMILQYILNPFDFLATRYPNNITIVSYMANVIKDLFVIYCWLCLYRQHFVFFEISSFVVVLVLIESFYGLYPYHSLITFETFLIP